MRVLISLPHPTEKGGPVSHLPLLYDALKNIDGIKIKSFLYGNRKIQFLPRAFTTFFISRIVISLVDFLKYTFLLLLFRPNIVHLNSVFDYYGIIRDIPYILLCKITRMKIFIKTHGSNENLIHSKNRFIQLLIFIYLKNVDGVGLLSEVEKNQFCEKFKSQKKIFFTVKNIVNINYSQHSLNSHKNHNQLIFAGRFVSKKNIDQFFIAFSNLVKRYPNLKLKMVGDGELKVKLFSFAQDLGILNYIDWEGWVSRKDLFKLINQSEVLVFCSKGSEGMPMIILETLCTDTLIVTTKTRFVRSYSFQNLGCEIIENNNADSIFNSLNIIFDKDSNRYGKQITINRKSFLSQFQDETVAADFHKIYLQLI
tara:strand:+ start:7688 stop:8791 length:1104 start_codon:yes stop_codon:yes gene_type:complete